MATKKRAKKRTSRNLVLGYLENVSSRVFADYPQELAELVRKRHGVYALYKGKRLYYVGLATNLRVRLKQHLKDRHSGKWDSFSIYLVRNSSHIREIESLILRIANPAGNTIKGRLSRAENLRPDLKRQLKETHGKWLEKVLGGKRRAPSTRKRVTRKTRTRKAPSLAPYVTKRFRVKNVYKGKTYNASVRSDGTIQYRGNVYTTPTAAAKVITKGPVSGWGFWKYRNKAGEWVKLADVRKR